MYFSFIHFFFTHYCQDVYLAATAAEAEVDAAAAAAVVEDDVL